MLEGVWSAGAFWLGGFFPGDHMHYIPMRSMLSAKLDNYVATGRCVDGDVSALSSIRVMGRAWPQAKSGENFVPGWQGERSCGGYPHAYDNDSAQHHGLTKRADEKDDWQQGQESLFTLRLLPVLWARPVGGQEFPAATVFYYTFSATLHMSSLNRSMLF